MSDETIFKISRVKFALHRTLMGMLGVPVDSLTSDGPFRDEFIARLKDDCPGYPYMDDAVKEIRRGIFGTLPMMEMAHAEGMLSDDDLHDLRKAFYFCNGARNFDKETVLPDGTRFMFSETKLGKWERILHLGPIGRK